jgi:transcriptional regulator with XRE-family HTH domain
MNDSIELGKTIAQFRKMEKYTITQLAEKIKISSSMLSQIERGISNPSINTLRMLSEALQVPLFRFFTPTENTFNLIVKSDKRKKIVFPESPDLEYEIVSPNLSDSIGMLMLKLSPHSASATQFTKHTGEEIAYVLEGDVQLTLEKHIVNITIGDSVKIPPRMTHKWDNLTDKMVKIIFAITPPRV